MTDRREIEELQAKARRAGRVCNLIINEQGFVGAVFYCGRMTSPLSFAERERAKPAWYEQGKKASGVQS